MHSNDKSVQQGFSAANSEQLTSGDVVTLDILLTQKEQQTTYLLETRREAEQENNIYFHSEAEL